LIKPDTSEIVRGRLAYNVDPKFPNEARKRKISGTAQLEVTVEKNGSVNDISILSGDLMLAEAAVDAVRRWTFEPYKQSGGPAEARQKLTFNFLPGQKIGQLDTPLAAPTLAAGLGIFPRSEDSSRDSTYTPGGSVTAPWVVHATAPESTELARKTKLHGTCILSLIVGPEGEPHDIKVVRALGEGLDIKAVEAVSKWRFQPGTKDGQPVAVRVPVEVSFHVPESE
jgi:TonB family protein